MRMEFKHIEYFVETCRHKSITEAPAACICLSRL